MDLSVNEIGCLLSVVFASGLNMLLIFTILIPKSSPLEVLSVGLIHAEVILVELVVLTLMVLEKEEGFLITLETLVNVVKDLTDTEALEETFIKFDFRFEAPALQHLTLRGTVADADMLGKVVVVEYCGEEATVISSGATVAVDCRGVVVVVDNLGNVTDIDGRGAVPTAIISGVEVEDGRSTVVTADIFETLV